MKYDAPIDPTDANSSHGLITELVGTGKRVLDIGCSTGLLAEALTERGNMVSGIDIDSDVAEPAESRVEKLVIGDMETLDLVEEFGSGSFDVVIFADVLEHLRNPAEVLRRARGVLSEDGYAVLSIPNVAHASVRLALLDGHFDYRPVGLLDDTHLRFFTRSTVEDLVIASGYFPAEVRRTRLGIFATEIPVRPETTDPNVLNELQHDPEAETYQFVVRALPLGTSAAEAAVAEDALAKGRELRRMQSELDLMGRLVAPSSFGPTLGILLDGVPSALDRFRVATLHAEMVRRLTGYGVRFYALSESKEVVGLTGEVAQALFPWDPECARRMAREVDTVIAIDSGAVEDRAQFLAIADDLRASGLPVHVMATGPMKESLGDPEALMDPLVLGGRLFAPALLEERLDYLRVVGSLSASERYLLTSFVDFPAEETASVVSALFSLSRRLDAQVMVVPLASGPDGHRLADHRNHQFSSFGDPEPIDIAALVLCAEMVVTDVPGLAALASGMGTPVVAVAADADSRISLGGWVSQSAVVTDIGGLVAAAEVARAAVGVPDGDPQVVRLETFLDDLSDAVARSVGRRFAQSVPQRIDELVDQVNVLEASNAGLRAALVRERQALATRAHAMIDREPFEGRQPIDEVRTQRVLEYSVLADAHDEIERLRFELNAVYGTRTMRTVEPARRVYSKLRALRK